MSSSGFFQKYERGRREAPRLPEYRPHKPLGRSRVRLVPGKTPTGAQELRVPGGRAPRGARKRAGAKPTGHCSPDSPGRRRAQGVHLPTCLRRAQSGQTRQGQVDGRGGRGWAEKAGWASRGAGSSRTGGGVAASARAALYPGEEAPRRRPVTPGPAGPGGLPPRHSLAPARCPTIATDLSADRHRGPEQESKRPLPPRAGQQQASARPGPTRLNGPLQPVEPGARTVIGGGMRRSVAMSVPTGYDSCQSSSRPCEPASYPSAHWLQPSRLRPQWLPSSPEGQWTSEVRVGRGHRVSGGRWAAAEKGLRSSVRLGSQMLGSQGPPSSAPTRAFRAFQSWPVLASLTLCLEYRPASPALTRLCRETFGRSAIVGEAGAADGYDARAAPGTPGSWLQFLAGVGVQRPKSTEAGSGGAVRGPDRRGRRRRAARPRARILARPQCCWPCMPR